ncbi:MAG: ABC transporter ATP-binding protein [Planctomycetes bacterium]|nr:ABC transporter ATP-binding protein [Planctomycetota bacterium]
MEQILVKNLVKRYGHRTALSIPHLVVEPGEFVMLLGANGAGKSTFLKILATLAQADSGGINIGPHDIWKHRKSIRRYVGYLSHETLLSHHLTLRENLSALADLYDVERKSEAIPRILKQVELAGRADEPLSGFSRGMLQRAAISRVILIDPLLMLLDEPFTGLDIKHKELLLSLLGNLGEGGRTTIMVTHDLEFAQNLATRYIILRGGQIYFDGRAYDEAAEHFRKSFDGVAM